MQKIIVENFGPIKHAEVELRDFVVLIGEQASGKSTLAKLVYFFKKFPSVYTAISALSIMDSGTSGKLHDWESTQSAFLNEAYKSFIQHFGQAIDLDPFEIKFYFSLERDKWVLFRRMKNGESTTGIAILTSFSKGFIDSFNSEIRDLANEFGAMKRDNIQINPNDSEEERRKKFNNFIDPINQFSKTVFESTDDVIYFPASRNITVNFSGLFVDTFKETISKRENTLVNRSGWILMKSFLDHVGNINEDFKIHGDFESMARNYKSLGFSFDEAAVKAFIDRTNSIIKGKYSNNGQGEKIYLDDITGKFVYLENASSGQQESIRLLQDSFILLLKQQLVLRIIEEPESHLFPTAQKYLLELFSLIANETNSQYFITTHSPYVLSVLSNLLYAKRIDSLRAASTDEIEDKSGLNRKTWLDKEQFAAYAMENGGAKSIFDRDNTGLIDQNYLDQVSEDLGREFQVLHNFRLTQIRKEKQV